MTPINYMRIQEALDLGVIQEVNRLVLHPLGLALEVSTPERSAFATQMRIWDYREDPEGIYFADDTVKAEKAERIAELMLERRAGRKEALGYVIQPASDEKPTLTTTYVDPAERIRGRQ